MKKSLLAMALALALTPFVFAAQDNGSTTGQTSPVTKTAKVKTPKVKQAKVKKVKVAKVKTPKVKKTKTPATAPSAGSH